MQNVNFSNFASPVKVNNNRHFGPIHQLFVARIFKPKHYMKNPRRSSSYLSIHLWSILWPQNFRHRIKIAGGGRFGTRVATDVATHTQIALRYSSSRQIAPPVVLMVHFGTLTDFIGLYGISSQTQDRL